MASSPERPLVESSSSRIRLNSVDSFVEPIGLNAETFFFFSRISFPEKENQTYNHPFLENEPTAYKCEGGGLVFG